VDPRTLSCMSTSERASAMNVGRWSQPATEVQQRSTATRWAITALAQPPLATVWPIRPALTVLARATDQKRWLSSPSRAPGR
jgi:hypothetical protein